MEHNARKAFGKAFIGIDIGTTTIKGGILDVERMRISNVRSIPFPAAIEALGGLRFEVSPPAVLAAVTEIIEGLLYGQPNCAGLVMCSQMHGLILLSQQ